jgi:flavin-dependent dehydrogenase
METIDQSAQPDRARAADFDLIVIGGGPAGTSAAITAARDGARVLLLERAKLPRQRVCGEFVSAESLALLAGLLQGAATNVLDGALRIPEARLFFDGHVVSAPVTPAAASIARFDLDAALWRAAEAAGVIGEQQTIVDEISGDGPFFVSTSKGELRARAVINASGRWSNLQSKAPTPLQDSAPKHSGSKWLGVKAHFAETSPHLSVDLYFFDGGYCGVQPVTLGGDETANGRINACAMVRSDVARSLTDVFAQQPQLQQRAQTWQALMEPVSTSPLIFRDPKPVVGSVLMAGDAAGFVDPFVGDGISLALRSGALAAQSLTPFFQAQYSLAEAASKYGEDYRRRMLPIFRNSSRIRRLLGLPRPIRNSVGHLLQAVPAVSRLLVRLTR